jgi:hypothetical protein
MVLAAGCQESGPAAPAVAVVDSAGVEVVTTATPVWGDESSPWTLSSLSDIGELDGREEYLFGEIIDVALVPDVGVAVADNQTADVRFFDGSGAYISRSGGHGEGPGEFGMFAWLQRCGGRLVAYDFALRRITPIEFDGSVGDPVEFRTPEGRVPYSSRCLPDGSYLVAGWGERPTDGRPRDEAYMYSQPAPVWRLSGDSAVEFGTYVSSERLMGRGGSGPHPFGRAVVFDGDGANVFIGDATRFSLEVRDLSGRLVRVLRGPESDTDFGLDFVSRYRAQELDEHGELMRRFMEEADFPLPDRIPAYTSILVDELGYVWIERLSLAPSENVRWGVFDPTGQFLGHVTFPPGFQLRDIAVDRVAGISTDELGVDRVRLFELDRGAPE